MTRREQGDLIGWSSVAASAILWIFGSIIAYTKWLPPDWLVINGAFGLSILSIALPIIAGVKASKLWFLMLLSPLIGYFVLMTHVCG